MDGKGPSFVLCRIYQKSGVGPRKPRAFFGVPFTEEMVEATQALLPDRKALQMPDVVVDTTPIVIEDDAPEQNCVYISDDSEQVSTYNLPWQVYQFLVSAFFSFPFFFCLNGLISKS